MAEVRLVLDVEVTPADAETADRDTIAVTDVAGRRVEIARPVNCVMLGEGRLLHLVAAPPPG